MKKIFSLVSLFIFASAANAATLTVYTYDSFTSDWGPGPKVTEAFEAVCDCKLKLVGLEDGVSLLNRLKIEGSNSEADIVLGIDTNLTAEARATGLFAPHGVQASNLAVPNGWTDTDFLPYDFGYFAFVHNKEILANPPTSLKQLVEDENGPNILIQDPRTSTPGLGLLLWMKSVYGDNTASAWEKLAPRVVTVTKGWSEAYGMFLKDEAPLVLSYTTSPAYHAIAEEDHRFAAADFSDGHYMQIEVAGILKASKQMDLAKQFMSFMLSEDFQTIIPTNNWMYPAALSADLLPDGFKNLVDPSPVLLISGEEVSKNRKQWVSEWLEAMSQ